MTDYQEIVSALQQLPGVSGVAIVNSSGQLQTESGITLLSGLSSGELLIVFANVVDGFSLSQLLDTAARY